MSDRHIRLRTARVKAGFGSARSAALRFGWSPSTYAAHENGQNDFDDNATLRYAKAFKVKPTWLYLGQESSDEGFNYNFRIYGEVGPEGSISILDESSPDRQLYVQTRFKLEEQSKVFVFMDNGLFPKYRERDIAITIPFNMPKKHNIRYAGDCICYLENKDVLVRKAEPVKEYGIYDLSIFNSPIVRRERVMYLEPILSILSPYAWQAFIPGKSPLAWMDVPTADPDEI
jgi:hypothetical protein